MSASSVSGGEYISRWCVYVYFGYIRVSSSLFLIVSSGFSIKKIIVPNLDIIGLEYLYSYTVINTIQYLPSNH
jgi:hypothetical protein